MLRIARRLLDCDPDDYWVAVSAQLGGSIPADDAIWMRTDFAAGNHTVWRASTQSRDRATEAIVPVLYDHPAIQSYVARPSDLTPRRLTDVPPPRQKDERVALRLSQRLLGEEQLSVILGVTPPALGRGWILTRQGGGFRDRDVETATQLLPLLVVLDHFHRPDAAAWRAPVSSFRSDDDGRWADLTARERQVVNLLATGLTARAIGRLLGISARTVDKHLENAYRKLGRHDRLRVAVDLATTEPRHGLTADPSTG